jgi:DNA replication protein DnaC
VSEPAEQLKTLGRALMWSAATLADLAAAASSEQLAFLTQAMATETAHREQARKTRLAKAAGFPMPKTFTDYDWSRIKLPAAIERDYITGGQFITDRVNLVCYGPVGTGKTHLALAVGAAAVQAGIAVKFTTVSQLVLRLGQAKTAGTLDKTMRELAKIECLILDEYGYVPIDRDAARLLFQVVADAYEARSLVITTNVPFGNWGAVLTDDQLAAAMIDRIAHHGHLIVFEGESYRMRHALMRDQPDQKATAR